MNLQSSFRHSGPCLRKLNFTGLLNSVSKWMNQKICMFFSAGYSRFYIQPSDAYGRLFAYDKSFDRITTKTEKPLQQSDRIKYNTTTSDDPVIQQVCSYFSRLSSSPDLILSSSAKTQQQYTRPMLSSVSSCARRDPYILGISSLFVKATIYSSTKETAVHLIL